MDEMMISPKQMVVLQFILTGLDFHYVRHQKETVSRPLTTNHTQKQGKKHVLFKVFFFFLNYAI